jgi:hypothetical protein|nr:MAG TPA: hypothetical protein [Caudoviricetes sp.]
MPDETNIDAGATESTNQATGTEGGNEQAASAGAEGSTSSATTTQPEGNLLTGATVEAKEGDGEGSKPEGDQPADEKKEQPEGAPESYEDFKAPEGLKYDDQVMDAFKEVAKETNLSQAQAQNLLDKVAPVIAQRQMAQIAEVSKQWAERSQADKELSADWNRSMADIARVRDRFAKNEDGSVDPDIAEFMSTPIGNHPGLLKLLARAGRAIGEGSFPRGSEAGDGKVTPGDFYKSAKRG